MADVSIIYWSGTGNTKMMAEALEQELLANGKSVDISDVEEANADMVKGSSFVALGCPSMGAEELETVMDDYVDAIDVKDKNVVLFGSYDWGDGQWIRDWQERMESKGAIMKAEGLNVHLTPEDEDIEKCKALARDLIK
ncbi:MAG: flavodoxin domain-containing protein [Tissierellales bacterium]|jgi:flavodoxin short chain|nr:flavodoxin domain-containing protein [Tissierellales bacterium]